MTGQDVSALERLIIEAAYDWRHSAVIDDPIAGRLADAVDGLERALVAPAADEPPQWVPRTMRDARVGDVIRLAGATSMQARVVYAEIRPRLQHVKAGDRSWQYNGNTYHDDKPLAHERSYVRLDYDGVERDASGRPKLLDFSPGMAIEIQLTATELQAIELLGWENRLERA